MKLPEAREGMKVIRILSAMIDYMRANTIRSVIGGRLRQSSSGITIEIDHPKARSGGGGVASHPWRVRPNGDDTVAIAPGLMMGLVPNPVHDPMSPSAYLLLPMEGTYVSYAGGNVTVTESTGIIYAQVVLTSDLEQANGVDTGETEHNIESSLYRPSSIYAVYFSDTGAADQGGGGESIHMPIAEVTLADEIAGVALQILTHNPLIQIDSLSIESHVA